MSGWLNQAVTNGDLIVIFVTCLVCYLIFSFASIAWKRSCKRRKVG
jgi:ABC-type transport system involved in Fe-S cluster assembly fused permease/ATPase subunit